MAAAKAKTSILLAKNILSETCKSGNQVLLESGRAAYTTARSVYHTKVFRLSQHIDRLFTSVSGIFPEEQKKYNITREDIRSSVISNVSKARDYLIKVNPAVRDEKMDVKFSIIIEKPTENEHLPMSVLISPLSHCCQPPIICDVYNVVRSNATVKDSLWALKREEYYNKSGKSVEEIILCENNQIFEGGQSNFFAVKDGVVYTKGDGVLQGTVRSMVINICNNLHIPISETAPLLSEVMQWEACFITSTSRLVMNINTIRKDGTVLKEFSGDNTIMEKIQEAIEGELRCESEEMF